MFYIKASFDGTNEYRNTNDKFMTNEEQIEISGKLNKLLLTGDKYLKVIVEWKAKNIFYLKIVKRNLSAEVILLDEKIENSNFDLKTLFNYLVAQTNTLNKKSNVMFNIKKQ